MGHSRPCFVLVAVQIKAYQILDNLNSNIVSSYPLQVMDVSFFNYFKDLFPFCECMKSEMVISDMLR